MAFTEKATFWTWVIRGIGGVLNILESYQREQLEPSTHQLVLLEYQLSRLQSIYDHFGDTPARTKSQINMVRSFGCEEVLESGPDNLHPSTDKRL